MIEPEIQYDSGSFTTAGAGVATTNNIVAAPGAGTRIRLYYATMVVQAGSPAGRVEGRIRATGGGLIPVFLCCATAGNNGDHWVGHPNGVPLPANNGVDVQDLASVANMTYRISIGYTVERV